MGVLVCVILVLCSAVGVCGLYTAPHHHAIETRQVKVKFGLDKDRILKGRTITPSFLECGGKCETRLPDGRCMEIIGCNEELLFELIRIAILG
ncbi:hypothetical protein Pmani_015032 [Petrolisthes manimaculis]|uniref:Uncharacterized protein n=1 Tax=Petrolisthes manimaculis TaxID=1843537 RepID=A0AAE1PT14_9EUCA|nr:hypothetical protein Pmani_015032 [Petrolisthes manimaculis]